MQGLAPGILTSGGRQYATWSTTNKSSNITLSSSNLKFTGSGTTGGTCISSFGQSTGKWYWEITINSLPSLVAAGEMIGIATSFSNSAVLGNYANSAGYRRNAGSLTTTFLRNFGAGSAFVGTSCPDLAVGNVVGLALDLVGLTLKVYITGSQVGSTLSIPAGTWYAACGSDGSSGAATANFGNSAFSYTPPTGFNSGFYI